MSGSKKPTISLRLKVPLATYERIGEFRHAARLETRNAALVTLVNAGLAALSQPVTLPPPAKPKGGLVPFAGRAARP